MSDRAPGNISEETQGTAKKKTNPELLQHELDYRRTKQWDIFSWSSGILVAITGAMVALQRSTQLRINLRISVTVAIVVLAGYCYVWIRYNSDEEEQAVKLLKEETGWYVRGRHPPPGYRWAVVLLAVAALCATWLPL